MRHAVKGKKLNRDISSRRALFKNLTLSLIEHGQIKTTAAKAKAIRASVEKLITKAKAGTLHDRRLIDQTLNRTAAVNKLVDEIAKSIKRTSGYTRIVKLGSRRGDDAEMVRLEIIDWQPKVVAKAEKPAVKTEKVESTAETKAKKSRKTAVQESVAATKIKQPAGSAGSAKRIPQKRISGGK